VVLVKHMSCREILKDHNILTVSFLYVYTAYITIRGISSEDYPVINNRIEVGMVNHLQGIWCHKGFNGSNH
jgi:hypothetical protein